MNPYIYPKFKQDMSDAVSDFINSTNYSIKRIDDSSIILTNGIFNLNFYLDGVSMVATFNKIDGNEESFYKLFSKHNIEYKYPFDKENKYSYEEWNRYKVKKILEILKTDLKNYFGDKSL